MEKKRQTRAVTERQSQPSEVGQNQRPRWWQQLPDHMIADRLPGAAGGIRMQITQSKSKNVRGERAGRQSEVTGERT